MKIERNITYYSRIDENLVGEYNIDNIDFLVLKTLITPPKEDPLLYNAYRIDEKLALKLREEISFEFEFDKYDYFFECYQV